jgi:uncharacterized protein (TIRG00374 family)
VGAVVWWASKQPAPKLPRTRDDIAAALVALALYAVATCLRAERWRILLLDQGASPARSDMYGLTLVGFAGNNVLPARGGDVVRVVLGAPRAKTDWRTMVGTLLAERLLDIAVLASLFVFLALTIAGGTGLPHGQTLAWLAVGLAVLVLLATAVVRGLVRRGLWDRLRAFVTPMLASTVALRGRHGALMLGLTALIWGIEGCVWYAVGDAANVGMSPIEALYVLALASMFALVPSGPGYAGTVDAATILGIKAVGGSSRAAVSYLILVRFIVFVPITIVGLIVAVARYGGFRRLKAA